jgi:hypothetical protein
MGLIFLLSIAAGSGLFNVNAFASNQNDTDKMPSFVNANPDGKLWWPVFDGHHSLDQHTTDLRVFLPIVPALTLGIGCDRRWDYYEYLYQEQGYSTTVSGYRINETIYLDMKARLFPLIERTPSVNPDGAQYQPGIEFACPLNKRIENYFILWFRLPVTQSLTLGLGMAKAADYYNNSRLNGINDDGYITEQIFGFNVKLYTGSFFNTTRQGIIGWPNIEYTFGWSTTLEEDIGQDHDIRLMLPVMKFGFIGIGYRRRIDCYFNDPQGDVSLKYKAHRHLTVNYHIYSDKLIGR